MFGEKEIIGSSTVSLRNNSFTLPKFTFATPNERIHPIYSHDLNRLLLYSSSEFKAIYDNYVEKLNKARESGLIDYKRYTELRRFIFGSLMLPYEIISSNNRLLINVAAIKRLGIKNSVFVIGVDKHLELYADEDVYRLSLNKG